MVGIQSIHALCVVGQLSSVKLSLNELGKL